MKRTLDLRNGLLACAVLPILVGTALAQHETPSTRIAVVMAPCRWEGSRGEDTFLAEVGSPNGQQYFTAWLLQTYDPGLNPVFDLLDHIGMVDGSWEVGVLLFTGHGGSDFVSEHSIMMESFRDANDAVAHAACQARLDEYENAGWDVSGPDREIGLVQKEPGWWAIIMFDRAITNRGDGLATAKPLVYIATCCGYYMCPAYVGRGARVALGPDDAISRGLNRENVETFFKRMNGREGQAKRPVSAARDGLPLIDAVGAENTTLAPSVLTCSALCPIKRDDLVVYTFDTTCGTDVTPDIDGTNCTIIEEEWITNTTLRGKCSVPPAPGSYCFSLTLDGEHTYSAQNNAQLDGNTIPLGSNAEGPASGTVADDYLELFWCLDWMVSGDSDPEMAFPDDDCWCDLSDSGSMPRHVAQAGTTWIGWKPGGVIGSAGYWDFDDRGTRPCPVEDGFQEYIKNGAYAQGWISQDMYSQRGLWWHTEDFTDPSLACSAGPIGGTYSAWCGKFSADPGECFSAAPGYGHNWSQWLCRTVTLDPVTPRLQYNFMSDTQLAFDYAYVLIDAEFSNSCGWAGDDADTIRCYHGPHGITAEDIDLSNLCGDPGLCDDVTWCDYSGDSVKVCFVVVTDGTWDDEDGMYDTCDGAFTVDDIFIDTAYSSGDTVTTDFETGTLQGWSRCGGFSPGDYAAIRHRTSFINNDVCGFDNCDMEDCVLSLYNPNIPGQYGNGGHYAGRFFKMAWSPAIDLTGYPTRGYTLSYDTYVDLPIANWVFYRHFVSYLQCADCPVGAWSPAVSDNYAFYTPTPSCGERMWGFSQLVPVDADSIRIGLAVWNGCRAWETACTNGNESPIFDNVRVGIWDLSAPQASLRPVDNYTDSWPEDDELVLPAEPGNCDPGTSGNTALIDAANNKSQTGEFLRLADSLVVRLEGPNVYADLCFRIRPGPCTDITDPWWGRMGLSPVNCLVTEDMACVRMDTAFASGDGDTASLYEYQVVFEDYYASMIHEEDPRYMGEGEEIFPDSLFTPGTKIYYFIRTSFLPGPGPYACLPPTADPGDATTWYEVEVLPDRCKATSPGACLLYVDYYNRGAQEPIEAALAALGRTWDRFDLRAESSHQGNGIGNRLLGAGRYRLARGPIGPSFDHLQQYNVMFLNTGDFGTGVCISDGGTGTPNDPTNDIGFLDSWINEGRYKGLWLSGDNIATDLANAPLGPKPNFLNTTLSASLVGSSYRDFVGHPIDSSARCRMLTSEYGWCDFEDSFWPWPWWEYANYVHLTCSACPSASNYDVLGYGGGGGYTYYLHQYDRTDLTHGPGGLAASIYHTFQAAGAPFDSVKTIIDGFSLHKLRDGANCGPQYPGLDYHVAIALMLRDRLGDDQGHGCPFFDQDLGIQYCPADGIDTVTGVEIPGPVYANALYQNYPNPFRSASGTTIHYSVAKAGKVEVRIFDVAGRLLRAIVDQAKPGENFVIWDGTASDGRRVASGVYFYQLEAGEFTSQKKMLMID